MSVAEQAKAIYIDEYKTRLETENPGKFVAIEPISKNYYLGETFIEAALAAKQAHPEHKSFVIRIGYDAAFHIGSGSA